MLGLLLCFQALFLLPSAAQIYTGPAMVDISSCPIKYFGETYTQLYFYADALRFMIHFGEIIDGNLASFIRFFDVKAETVSITLDVDVSAFDSDIQAAITHLTDPSLCGHHLSMVFSQGSSPSDVYLMSFEHQAAVHVIVDIDFLPSRENIVIYSNYELVHSIPLSAVINEVDLSGCSYQGVPYSIDDEITIKPETCSTLTCRSTGISETSFCSPTQFCMGSSMCGVETFCSVVGPSVLDMKGATGKSPDFCHYTLLTASEISVKGAFKSHRHTDVPFLHEVVLTTTGTITITQGGVVYKDNNPDLEVVLSTTLVTEFGVQLSKDQTGVMAVFTDSMGSITSVFYDGTLFSVNLKKPSPSSLIPLGAGPYSGLCSDVSSISTNVDASLSTEGCDSITPDTDGDDIDCIVVTQSCTDKLTSLATAINCSVDIAPFVTSCATNLLCGYPNEDGLICSILDAYAQACQTQEDWRASLSCPISACVNHLCGSNEFCAINIADEAACFCQDIFATPYRTATLHTFGEPATCDAGRALAALYTCFLEESGVDPNNLHLLDSNCTGAYNDSLKTISFGFSSSSLCGGTVEENADQIIYTNTIANTQGGDITHENDLSIEFSCAYNQPTSVSTASFTIADGAVFLTYATSEVNFTIAVSPFTDAALTEPVVRNIPLDLDQKVWVQLEAQGLGGSSLALLINDCWATVGGEPNEIPRYDMITNSCVVPADGSVELVSNGESMTSVLAFNMFEFVGATLLDLSLHCTVKLCILGTSCATSACG